MPKPLLPICNQPIMQYQIEAMRDAGIKDIAVVIASNGSAICDHFGNGAELGVRLHYIEDSAPAGIASSLALAESWVRGPFAVFLGDIFLALGDLGPLLNPMRKGATAVLAVRRDSIDAVKRNFAVVAQPDGRVTRVIEKPTAPPTDLKGCGVYAFDPAIFDAIRRTPRSALRNEFEITDAVQILVDMGKAIYVAEVVRWDVNITYPDDLLACNLRLLRERQLESLIGAGVTLVPGARLRSTIVGDRATVSAPVQLEECLVFPDAHVSQGAGPMRQQIFADGIVWTAGSAD